MQNEWVFATVMECNTLDHVMWLNMHTAYLKNAESHPSSVSKRMPQLTNWSIITTTSGT